MEKYIQPNKQQNNVDPKLLSLWGMPTPKEQLRVLCVAAAFVENKEELYLCADAMGLSSVLQEREIALKSQDNLQN